MSDSEELTFIEPVIIFYLFSTKSPIDETSERNSHGFPMYFPLQNLFFLSEAPSLSIHNVIFFLHL
jgi:hypothetical protein